jgi:hypothetical protein
MSREYKIYIKVKFEPKDISKLTNESLANLEASFVEALEDIWEIKNFISFRPKGEEQYIEIAAGGDGYIHSGRSEKAKASEIADAILNVFNNSQITIETTCLENLPCNVYSFNGGRSLK